MTSPAILSFPVFPKRLATRVPLLFRARDCEDEQGVYALSYGKRVGLVHQRSVGATGVAAVFDRDGRVTWVPADLPRLSWEHTSAGTRERTLRLEPVRSTRVLHAQALSNAVWNNGGGATRVAGAKRGPDGRMSGWAVSSGILQQLFSFTNDGTKAFFWVLAAGTAPVSRINVLGHVGGGLAGVDITWNGILPPTLTVQAGAAQTGVVFGALPLGAPADGWYLIAAQITGVTAVANAHSLDLIPDITFGAGTVHAYHGQAENASLFSSMIRSLTTTLSRATDTAYFPVELAPGACTLFGRDVNRGNFFSSGALKRFLHLGSSDPTASPRLQLAGTTGGTTAQALYSDGTAVTSSPGAISPALNDVVDARAVLTSDWRVRAGAAKNGASETLGALSSARGPVSGWLAKRLYLGGLTQESGESALAAVLLAEGDVPLDVCRELCEVA